MNQLDQEILKFYKEAEAREQALIVKVQQLMIENKELKKAKGVI